MKIGVTTKVNDKVHHIMLNGGYWFQPNSHVSVKAFSPSKIIIKILAKTTAEMQRTSGQSCDDISSSRAGRQMEAAQTFPKQTSWQTGSEKLRDAR